MTVFGEETGTSLQMGFVSSYFPSGGVEGRHLENVGQFRYFATSRELTKALPADGCFRIVGLGIPGKFAGI
jgi:hypothetical protein